MQENRGATAAGRAAPKGLVIVAAVCGVLLGGPASAGDPPQTCGLAVLFGGDGTHEDGFGSSVAVSGNTIVVGSPFANGVNGGSGAAYVYVGSGDSWTQQAKLEATDGSGGDSFGIAVDIDGDRIIVGAPGHNDPVSGAGAAYIYDRSGLTWTQDNTILLASDGGLGHGFGYSVSLDGDRAAVGAPDNPSPLEIGTAYVFELTSGVWQEVDEVFASDFANGDDFGTSVDLLGDWLAVGTPGDDQAGGDSGSVYMFQRSGSDWSETQRLQSSPGANEAFFGQSVSLDSNWMAVGAPGELNGSGAAYTFLRISGNWVQIQRVTSHDPEALELFGYSVDLQGGTLAVGAPAAVVSDGKGSSYLFDQNGFDWDLIEHLLPVTALASEGCGVSVGVFGDTIVAGSFGNDLVASNAGAAYVYDATQPGAWDDLGNALAGTHGDPRLCGAGPLQGGDPFFLGLTDARESALAGLFIGFSAVNLPFEGGLLVPAPDELLLVTTDGSGGIIGGAFWPFGVPPGTEVFFQWWIVDPAGPFGLAGSNAIRATGP